MTEQKRKEISDWVSIHVSPGTKFTIDDNGEVDVKGSVIVWNEDDFSVKFKKISGSLIVFMGKMDDLSFCPAEIGLNFEISHSTIKSLKGFPKKVGHKITLRGNVGLTSLRFFPKKVFGDCVIAENVNLKSLKYGPVECYGDFTCCDNGLTNFDHCPKKLSGFLSTGNPVYKAGVYTDELTGIKYKCNESLLFNLLNFSKVERMSQ